MKVTDSLAIFQVYNVTNNFYLVGDLQRYERLFICYDIHSFRLNYCYGEFNEEINNNLDLIVWQSYKL